MMNDGKHTVLKVIDGPYTKHTKSNAASVMDYVALLRQCRSCAEALGYSLATHNNFAQVDPYNVWCVPEGGGMPWLFDPFHNDTHFLKLQQWLIDNGHRLDISREWIHYWHEENERPLIMRTGSLERHRSAIIECASKIYDEQKLVENKS